MKFGNGAGGWTGVDRLIDASGSLPPTLRDLSGAFLGASRLVGSGFRGWDVSGVTDMSYMFKDASGCYTNGTFRTDLSEWSAVSAVFFSWYSFTVSFFMSSFLASCATATCAWAS